MKKHIIGLAVCAVVSMSALSQGNALKNQIGDKAPELRYGKWLKGTPVKEYIPGRLYILEFWATWCGPCIQQMPHLSKLAKERAKDVTIIGVNTWESKGDSTKPYKASFPKVEKFVKSMGDKMAYDIITDTDDEFMGTNWMTAGGQGGLPTSFLVKDGIIMWVGHPIDLDSMIDLVHSPKYDVVAARKAADDKRISLNSGGDNFQKTFKSFNEAVKAKDFTTAFKISDEEIAKGLGNASAFSYFKFEALLNNVGEDTAMAFLRKWQDAYGGFGFTNSIGGMLTMKPGLKKSSYQYGIDMLKGTVNGPNTIPPLWYNMIAKGYFHMGDYKTAVETQEKVITLARQALKEEKFVGFILEDTVKEYEKTLAEYKSKLK